MRCLPNWRQVVNGGGKERGYAVNRVVLGVVVPVLEQSRELAVTVGHMSLVAPLNAEITLPRARSDWLIFLGLVQT